jgi:hypothetical protein
LSARSGREQSRNGALKLQVPTGQVNFDLSGESESPVLFIRKLKVRKREDVDSNLRAQYHTTGDHAMRIEQMNLSK